MASLCPSLTSKRHISFYNKKEYTNVCSGINLKSQCTNTDCESVRNMGGLVIVKCLDLDTCVYQDVVYNLPCPSCGTVLNPQQFSGVVFASCEAKVSVADKSELLRASQEETVFWGMEYMGPEIRISIVERESESAPSPLDISKNYLFPTNGVNLAAMCRRNDCLAFKNNQGLVVVRVGLINSAVFQELVKYRNCPCCNCELDADSFNAVTFIGCRAQLEVGGKVETFDATSVPKHFKIEAVGPRAVIRVNRDLVTPSPELAIPGKKAMPAGDLSTGALKEGSENFLRNSPSVDRTESSKMEPGVNFMANCPKSGCGSVVIPLEHIVSCKFKEAIRGMSCPSCKQVLPPASFTGVAFLQCKASVQTEEKKILYQPGRTAEIFKINPEGPDVEISVQDRTGKGQPPSDNKYIKVCDGVNFVTRCDNPDCLSVQEYDGSVRVKRDKQFIQRGGFPPNRCNYSIEIQNLKCPSCNVRLNSKVASGVVLVRCKGTIEFAGKSQNFEAIKNDFVRFDLDQSDPRTFVEYEVVNLKPHGPGLNVMFRCPNLSCSDKDHPLLKNVVFIKLGIVKGYKVNEMMLTEHCPLCKHNIPIDKIVALLFNDCTAVVRIRGKETHYLTGSSVQHFRFIFRDNIEVDIFPVIARDISLLKLNDNPFFSLKTGLNVEAICSNQGCEAKRMHEGRVCINYPKVKDSQLSELFSFLFCPACGAPLSEPSLLCLSFVECKALVQGAEKKYLIEPASEEVIDFERSLLNSDFSIQVLSLDDEFPESREGQISKGSEYSHSSLCHGLNFEASCTNPTCVSEQNHQYVNIMSGHLLDFDYRLAVQSLTCPCCENPIAPREVKRINVLCCTGEVRIGGRVVKFDYSGDKISEITIPNDESDVWIKVVHRTYDVFTHPLIPYMRKPFRALCKGLNFRCYCKNPLCNTFKQRDGLVNVQRDTVFANSHGYNHKVCNYRVEISNLRCPDCSNPLRRYFVWGVIFSCCSGTITRNGSPPEKFSTLAGKVVLYALDRDDESVRIEFSV